MANKYRGVTWNNAGAGPKVRIRRSIWLAELADFGAITDTPVDLPTAGAVHRGSLGATSGTRSYVDLSTVNNLAVVDTQDHGLISENATAATVWKTNSENTNVVTPPSPSSYNWNITTTIDHPTNLSNIDTNNYDDANYQAQLEEGDTMTWTATTNAPDGMSVFFTCVSTYYGSYQSAGDPNNIDISGQPGTSGTITVSNGQVSGTITAISDNAAEDGELRQVWLMPQAGDYSNILAKSQWFHIADPSGTSGGGGTEPAVGTWLYGGEAVAAGWNETHWNSTTSTITVKFDTSSTATSSYGTPNDDWEWVLDDWAAGNGSGDVIQIRGGGITPVYMSINGTVTKTQIGSSDTYYYAIPVNVTSGTVPANSGGYIVLNQYLQHQHNG